jgi:type VI secretion system protein ImpL
MRAWVFGLLLVFLLCGAFLALRQLGVELPVSSLLAACVLVGACVAAFYAYRSYRARAAARALEAELTKLPDAGLSAERQGELVALKVQFEKGIRALKESRIADGGNALYALPWYVIVGPPGAGKTTALRYSGLNFPFLDPREGGGIKGVGGTRNCDWWFTNEAVLLDTAGRYVSTDEDRDEWVAFLTSLRRYRSEKPINGVVLAVGLDSIIDGSEQANVTLARTLRTRIDELQSRLEMVVPVYVMFTKVDLVAGFVEFFDGLKRSERDQMFGATVSLEATQRARAGTLFEREMDLLLESLQAREIKQVQEQHEPERRQRAFQFPLELAATRKPLSEFLTTLFEANGSDEKPIFRGFYFTSGTQEGSPIDRAFGRIARAFGMETDVQSNATVESKSYFVTDLFRRVVFPDQKIAARTSREVRRRWVQRTIIAAGVGLLAMVVLIGPALSFRRNLDILDASSNAAKGASRVGWANASTRTLQDKELNTLRAQVAQLEDWRSSGPPAGLRWGMYVGEEVRRPLLDVYIRSIEAGLSPYRRQTVAALQNLSLDAASGDGYEQAYDRLKLYLMLSEPGRIDLAWATPRLAVAWASASGSTDPAADGPLLEPHVDQYLQLLQQSEAKPWPRDEGATSRARTELLRTPLLDRMFDALVRQTNLDVPAIRHSDIFGGAVSPYFKARRGVEVQGAYTKAGWERVRKLLTSQRARLAGEVWVLGEDKSREGVAEMLTKLRARYFETYKRAWHELFLDAEVHEPENAEIALAELSALSEPPWVYGRLMRLLDENATLDVTSEEELTGVAKTIVDRGKQAVAQKLGADKERPAERPISPVEVAFAPIGDFVGHPPKDGAKPEKSGLDEYQGAIAKLVAVLTDMKDGDAAPDPQKVVGEFEAAYRATSTLLANQSGYTRPMLSPLLMRPIAFAWAGVVKDAGGAASGLWETTVWDVWRLKMEHRYPFEQSVSETTLADFSAFFKPKEGLLWAFYEGNLKGSLTRKGGDFEPSRRFATTSRFVPGFVDKCLGRGDEITNAIFSDGANAKVKFRVNLHSVSPNVSEVLLDIDGATHAYKNHPEQWLDAQWPAEKPERRGAHVRVRGENGLDEEIVRLGDFGFYRLLDAAAKVESGRAGGRANGQPVIVATWHLRGQDAEIQLDFAPTKDDRALTPALFRAYTCPRVIAR